MSADARPLRIYRVDEGPESHLVFAEDEGQARGIAFGHRFADPDEWGTSTMHVETVEHRAAMLVALRSDEGGMPTTLAFEFARATGPVYVGGTLW